MYDELTSIDIEKMKAELEHRITVVRPQCIEEVKTAREFGDLSENYEYKAAKQAKNRNESRIRYLERMIKTAKIVSADSAQDVVGLFDTVELYIEAEDETETIQLVTPLRQNALQGRITKESPVGQAVFGHRAGDRVLVQVNPQYSYYVQIRKLTKGEDDASLPILPY